MVICSGLFDIFVELVCASNDELFDVLDSKVRTLPGVDEIETFLYLDLHYKRLGPVTVEAYTVAHQKGAMSRAIVSCLTDEGERTWATLTDPDTLAAMMREEFCGRQAHIHGGGELRFS